MKFSKFFAGAAALLTVATSVCASPITVTLNAPAFTTYSGPWSAGSHISGVMTFDSSLLDAAGNGVAETSSYSIKPNFTWSFTDGLNTFNNINTTQNFDIAVSFAAFVPTSWNIDPTFGVTPMGDIFVNSSGRNESYYNNAFAAGPNASVSNWVVTRQANVPEPGSLALIGLGLAGAAAMRRRKV